MRKRRGFTLIELLVVIAIIALLIAILLPSLSRARELSKRLVCLANVKGIGTSCKIYANDNQESWPVPAFNTTALNGANPENTISVDYMGNGGDFLATLPPGWFPRNQISEPASSSGMSTTRAFWMLVRSGDVTVKQFICPSANHTPDGTEEINRYYDFASLNNVSYGYQVPFGAGDTRASENLDNRMALVADGSPYRLANIPQAGNMDVNTDGSPNTTSPNGLSPSSPPNRWRVFNSPNHGGTSTGEGQNILFADGHGEFAMRPCVGVDKDNIYTRMIGSTAGFMNTPAPFIFPGVYGGSSPWQAHGGLVPANKAWPGQAAFPTSPLRHASTDSLIFP